jgi:hypothetical protein
LLLPPHETKKIVAAQIEKRQTPADHLLLSRVRKTHPESIGKSKAPPRSRSNPKRRISIEEAWAALVLTTS